MLGVHPLFQSAMKFTVVLDWVRDSHYQCKSNFLFLILILYEHFEVQFILKLDFHQKEEKTERHYISTIGGVGCFVWHEQQLFFIQFEHYDILFLL